MPSRRPEPAAPAPRTVGDWLRWAEAAYARAGAALGQTAADAHDEALYLLLHALQLPLDTPPAVLSRALTAAETSAVRALFRRRLDDRVPAAYLTRETWLGGRRFYVDERVIVPRSYFVELIPQLPALLPGVTVRHAADVCTGSGCLAILLAQQFPSARIDALDLSPDALDVARRNVRAHRLTRRITLRASDVFAAVPPARYDLILSNPPYEPSAHVDRQAAEFRAEPRLAHDGGPDGLAIIRQLLRQARDRLQPHGLVVIEIGGLRRAIDREFRALAPEWLPTADGTHCVCLFRAAKLA